MKRGCQGFSLLEVLVAFVILALVLGVLMRIMSGGLANIGTTERYARAVSIAESHLTALGIESPLVEGEYELQVSREYRMRTVITRYVDDITLGNVGTPMGLYRIDVDVRWGEGAGSGVQFITLRTALKP